MKKFLASLLLMVFIIPMTLQAQGVASKFFYDFNDNSIAEWKVVDRDNDGNGDFHRERKDSFYWYKKVIASNGEDLAGPCVEQV